MYTIACQEGEYKSIQGNEDCVKCPENSNSTQTGATSCECIRGYYRASSENITIKCTGKLSKQLMTKTIQECKGSATLILLVINDDSCLPR